MDCCLLSWWSACAYLHSQNLWWLDKCKPFYWLDIIVVLDCNKQASSSQYKLLHLLPSIVDFAVPDCSRQSSPSLLSSIFRRLKDKKANENHQHRRKKQNSQNSLTIRRSFPKRFPYAVKPQFAAAIYPPERHFIEPGEQIPQHYTENSKYLCR